MARKIIKVGAVIPVKVTRDSIDESVPCNKAECMLTISGIKTLNSRFGKHDWNVKSTDHGMMFDIPGNYRVLCVFDNKTSTKIYKYDEIFRKTGSAARAKAAINPFLAKLMVESCQKKVVNGPMSEETKALLRANYRTRVKPTKKSGLKTPNARRLSQ